MIRISKLEIVASGIQKNGQPVLPKQLESVVRNYKADARPPVTPGHPKKGDDQIPALGRVANLRTEQGSGDKAGKTVLVGEVHYTPEMEKMEDSGEFEGFSAGIHPMPDNPDEWYMHHLAFLGQLPPAADTKTRDVVNLSANDFSDDVIYLTANVGTNPNPLTHKNESNTMDKEKLKGLLKDLSDDELAELGLSKADVTDANKANADKNNADKTNVDKGNANSQAPQGNVDANAESTAVAAMQETLAGDRKESLTELADSREMTAELRKSIDAMITDASAIELCASGDNSRYAQLKNMISAMPAKNETNGWGQMLSQKLELANTTGEQTKTFNAENW